MTPRAPTEPEWQTTVIDLAALGGWLAAHFRPARTASGWRTAVSADGAGFPDLVLVRVTRRPEERDALMRPPLLILAELKGERGRLDPRQKAWRAALERVERRTDGVVAYRLWRPSDFEAVRATLAPHVRSTA